MASTVRLDQTTLGTLALELIKDPGMHLGHLAGVPLVFVFETGWKGDKEFLFGRVSMKSHLTAVALRGMLREGEPIECDNSEKCFLIEVNHELWIAISNPDSGYKPEEAEARRRQGMYHLLLHCNIHPETQALMTSKPDTALFAEEISVWGEDCIPLKAVMARLKNRPTENNLLQSLYLTPQEWIRAQAVSGIDRPKRGFKLGKGKDILVIGGGVRPGAGQDLHTAFLVLGDFKCDEGGRYFPAVRIKAWESVHGQPELPYDTRFVVPGMQVETEGLAWDDAKGEDVDPESGRWIVAETGYRLLEPEYGVKVEDTETPEHSPLVIKVDEDLSDEDWEASAKRLGVPGTDEIGVGKELDTIGDAVAELVG